MIINHNSPFIYGRPVKNDEFINRELELRTVFNRIRNGESTAIVGEPHIGKSSFLLQLGQKNIQQKYLGRQAAGLISTVFINLHSIPSDYAPADFWEEALEPLAEKPGTKRIAGLLHAAHEKGFSRSELRRLFKALAGSERLLVLLLDEFDCLLNHANFREPSFFALLRGLSTNVGGLVLVPSSRLSIAELNRAGRDLLAAGSPLFNHNIEIRLGVFTPGQSDDLLALAGERFSQKERQFIQRVAGGSPFLLQGMAAACLEAGEQERQIQAAEIFYGRVAFHFDDLWACMDDASRTAAVILCLLEFDGRALGGVYNYGEIERVDAFGPELNKLAERGFAQRVEQREGAWIFDWERLLVWRGERWAVSSQAFAWWLRDVVIAGARDIPAYHEWLRSQQYRALLTQGQWDDLTAKLKQAPEWAIRGVAGLARAMWDELAKG